MCFCLYLATSSDPPLIDNEGPVGNGKIATRKLHEMRQEVRKKFTLAYVTAVGSDVGCGCGYRHDEAEIYDPGYDPSKTQPNHTALRAYLTEHCRAEPFVELYGCWDGDIWPWGERARYGVASASRLF